MRFFLCLVAGALSTLFAAASGATTLSASHVLTQSGTADSVSSFAFVVTEAGRFDIYTDGPTIDPVLYLFRDHGGDTRLTADDPLVARNDDGCRFGRYTFCRRAGRFQNSLLKGIELTVGHYFAVVSDYGFSEAEARRGINGTLLQRQETGLVTTHLTSAPYGAAGGVAALPPAIPLPSAGLLLLSTCAGLSLWARRRRTPAA